MDTVFFLSIFLILVGGLVGSFLRQRRRDRVLAPLHGYHVTAQLQGGERIWGRALVFANAIELVYTRPYLSRSGHTNTSFVMFKDSLDRVLVLYRFHDELSPANQLRRGAELRRNARPGLLRRSARHLRNFVNTFRDAINDSLGLPLARAKGGGSQVVPHGQDKRPQQLGSTALGVLDNAYDAVLERYLGHRVVLEVKPPGEGGRHELCGVLWEYSPAWISVLGCALPQEQQLPLGDAARLVLQRNLDFRLRFTLAGERMVLELSVRNCGEREVRVHRVEAVGYQRRIERSIGGGETLEWRLDDLPADVLVGLDRERLPLELAFVAPERQTEGAAKQPVAPPALPELMLVLTTVREADVYVPRALGTVRHGNEFLERGWSPWG